MAKRRGNPNWGKPEPIGPVVPTVTSFEQIVKEYKLTPDQYVRSTRLREWARRNRNSKYIPEALLKPGVLRSSLPCKSGTQNIWRRRPTGAAFLISAWVSFADSKHTPWPKWPRDAYTCLPGTCHLHRRPLACGKSIPGRATPHRILPGRF